MIFGLSAADSTVYVLKLKSCLIMAPVNEKQQNTIGLLKQAADEIKEIDEHVREELINHVETYKYANPKCVEHLETLMDQRKALTEKVKLFKKGETKFKATEAEALKLDKTIAITKKIMEKAIKYHPCVRGNLAKLNGHLAELNSVLLKTASDIEQGVECSTLEAYAERIIRDAAEYTRIEEESAVLQNKILDLSKSLIEERRQSRRELTEQNKSSARMAEELRKTKKDGLELRRQQATTSNETLKVLCEQDNMRMGQRILDLEQKIKDELEGHSVVMDHYEAKIQALKKHQKDQIEQHNQLLSQVMSQCQAKLTESERIQNNIFNLEELKKAGIESEKSTLYLEASLKEKRMTDQKLKEMKHLAANKIQRIVKRCLKRRKAIALASKKKKGKKKKSKKA